jgi:hypothetical protein
MNFRDALTIWMAKAALEFLGFLAVLTILVGSYFVFVAIPGRGRNRRP